MLLLCLVCAYWGTALKTHQLRIKHCRCALPDSLLQRLNGCRESIGRFFHWLLNSSHALLSCPEHPGKTNQRTNPPPRKSMKYSVDLSRNVNCFKRALFTPKEHINSVTHTWKPKDIRRTAVTALTFITLQVFPLSACHSGAL